MNTHTSHRRRGFTIAEAVIASLIILLFLAILLPAISNGPRRHPRVAVQAQLANLTSACESYQLTFNAPPGYLPDSSFTPASSPMFTASENLTVCLLGQVVAKADAQTPIVPAPPGLPIDRTIDIAKIGVGPVAESGRAYGAFYSPKPSELTLVTGTPGGDNNMPELVDVMNGMPILYYRIGRDPTAARSEAAPIADVADYYAAPGSTENSARIGRLANADYLNATGLQSPDKDAFDQSASLLNKAAAGDAATANANLARILRNRTTAQISGGFTLLSAGVDGVYFDREQIGKPTIDDDADLSKLDDLFVTAGQ